MVVSFFSELQKWQALKRLQNNESHEGFAHLVDAHCVALRHAAINAIRDKQAKRKLGKTNILSSEEDEEFNSNQTFCFHFSKTSFPTWLSELPHEWTVVHISEIWHGYESLRMLGFGPPPFVYSLPKLAIVRFHSGSPDTFITKILEKPSGGISGGSLLAELKSILEGNRSVNKDFRGNRDQYWKLKQEHHDQLKVDI